MPVSFCKYAVVLVVSLNPLVPGSAWAALGGGPGGIVSDGTQMQSRRTTTAFVDYDVCEIDTDAGVQIREYVDRSAVVFAVSWKGAVPPDLQTLLGAHYPDFASALKSIQHPGLHRSLKIATGGLVVELSGHMRGYYGRAYLTAAIPAGVTPAELR
jgi:hypothetical protein